MNILLTIAVAVAYLTASGLLLRRMSMGAEALSRSKLPPLLAGFVGAVIHAVLIHSAIIAPSGLNLDFFNVLSLIAWIVAVLVLAMAITQPVENLGLVILPLATLCVVLQGVWPTAPDLLVHITPEMQVHILISILAYSLLALAAVQAILLAVQDRHLRNRHPGGFIRALPPLETMENLLFQMIGVGFILLTISLITGFVFLHNMFAQHLAHKTILSVIAWLVFAVLLWGRWRFGWRGRKAIAWTMSGFLLLMLAYLGSKLVLELILHR